MLLFENATKKKLDVFGSGLSEFRDLSKIKPRFRG